MRIEREIINQFKAWKDAPNRKPILLMRCMRSIPVYEDIQVIVVDDNSAMLIPT